MNNIKVRKANLLDIDFIAKAIIEAEKSNTTRCGLSTLFNLSENEVEYYIKLMLKEKYKGCEFSLNSFLIASINNMNVATVGGWIETFKDQIPSYILRSELLYLTIPKKNIEFYITNSNIIDGIQIERTKNSLQIEYVYVDPDNRGKGIAALLINKHIKKAKTSFSNLNLVEVQVFGNNNAAINAFKKIGFIDYKHYYSNEKQAIDYLPNTEKILMRKKLN